MPRTIHPTSRTLVAYLDGELPAEERREIADHLRGCAGCQSDLDEIEADLDWHLVLDAALLPRNAPLEADGLQRLLGSIHQWRRMHPAEANAAIEAETRRGVEGRVGRALEVFEG